MTNISKKQLKKKVAEKIHKRFIKTIINLHGKGGERFIEEILTPSEQIMLAKRTMALSLLSSGASSYKVQKLLKLSPTTASRLKREMKNGKYKSIKSIKNNNGKDCKDEQDTFWADMEILVRFGMPEMGKNRWKWLDELYPNK